MNAEGQVVPMFFVFVDTSNIIDLVKEYQREVVYDNEPVQSPNQKEKKESRDSTKSSKKNLSESKLLKKSENKSPRKSPRKIPTERKSPRKIPTERSPRKIPDEPVVTLRETVEVKDSSRESSEEGGRRIIFAKKSSDSIKTPNID